MGENISVVLCPWSNLLCFADSLATVGGPAVVVTLVWSPPGSLLFFLHGLEQKKFFPALAIPLHSGF